jgi:hypothetical protein
MNSNEKTANLNVKLKDFFTKWIEFTRPFHKLNPKQSQVLSLLLYHHYRLSQEITNSKILWKEVFDYDTKLLIYEELNIQSGSLENLLSQLRRKNIVIDNKITPYFVPNVDKKTKEFKLIFNFKLIHE